MKILITNDDGIYAPGLAVLERIAKTMSEDVYVVAPESDQSGVAHSLSLNDPLRLREISPRHFAVKGTPTDCVIMGVKEILRDEPPNLILSGVNRGQNVAEDVTYSGTIAAAMEGTLLGIPSIALSQAYGGAAGRRNPRWPCGEAHAPEVIGKILRAGIPPDILINVNFPDRDPGAVEGSAITVQGRRDTGLMRVEQREDGRGNPYYWVCFGRGDTEPGQYTDLEALRAGRISITPLRLDLTDTATRERYLSVFG